MNNIILANIIMGIGALVHVLFMQSNNKKTLQIGLCIINFISVIGFAVLKRYSAIIVCFIAIIQIIIKTKYDKENKKIPVYLQFILVGISTFTGFFTVHSIFDIIPTICLVFFTLSILEPKENRFRIYSVLKLLGWIIYDLYAKAYVGFLFSTCVLISTCIAIIRYDILKKEDKAHAN